MEQMRLFDLESIPLVIPKYKGHPGRMCSECKDIFSVDHPYGGRKFYCRKQIANNCVGYKQIRKYASSCFMFSKGSQDIPNFLRNEFQSICESKRGIPLLKPKRWIVIR